MRLSRFVSTLAMALSSCHAGGQVNPADASPAPSAIAPEPSAPVRPAPSVDLMTHASMLEDSGDAASVTVGVDGARLRAKNKKRLHEDRSPVTVLTEPEGPNAARDLGRKLCETVVPKRAPETPVLLKPNIGGFDWFKDPEKSGGDDGLKGRITDPEFVRGVIQCLRARGHTHITVAEGWGATHKDWVRLVRASGYEAMTNEEHVPLLAMDDDGVFDKTEGEPGKPVGISGMEATHAPTLLMPKLLAEHLEHGLFLSLPKIKAHRFGVFSMSIKGMQGTVMLKDALPAFRQKWRMHRELNPYLEGRKNGGKDDRTAYVAAIEAFAERMSDVLEIEAPDAVLAEGAPAMGGDGFQKLWPLPAPIAIGGTNPILVDRVGAEWLGLWNNADLGRELLGHTTSPLLEIAAKRFDVDLSAPALTGDAKDLFAKRRPVHFVGMAPFAIHSDDTPAIRPGTLGLTAPLDAGKDSAPMANESQRPFAHAVPLGTNTIAIDGRGEDPAWKRAEPVVWDTDYSGRATGITTKARFLYSRDALYALFDVDGTGLHTDRSRKTDTPRDKLYEEDCVELFLTPDPSRPRHYYEVELGPFGHYFEVEIDLDRKLSNTSWSSRATIRTSQDPARHHAVIEAKLTAKEIASALEPGAQLPLGLFRMEGLSPRNYLAWSPARTPKPNFHVPAAFGALVLDR
jgi:uncharacterized protein (DUF362 family)